MQKRDSSIATLYVKMIDFEIVTWPRHAISATLSSTMIDFEIVTWPRHAIKADICSDRCLSALYPRIFTGGTHRTVLTSFVDNSVQNVTVA